MTYQELSHWFAIALGATLVYAGIGVAQTTTQEGEGAENAAEQTEEATTQDQEEVAVEGEAAREQEGQDGQETRPPRPGRAYLLGITLDKGAEGWPQAADVRPLSPAWDAGVRKGDVIKQTDGISGKPYDEWLETIRLLAREKKKGDVINFDIQRDDAELTLRVGSRGEEEDKVGIPDNDSHLRDEADFEGQDSTGYPQDYPPTSAAGTPPPPPTGPGGQATGGGQAGGQAYGVGVPIGGGAIGGQALDGQGNQPMQRDGTQRMNTDNALEGQVLSARQLEELSRLQQRAEQGDLSPQQRERFQRLQQMQEAGAFARESGQPSSMPGRPLTPNQARRLRQLEQAHLENRLSPQHMNEYQRLQRLQQSRQSSALTPQQRQQLMQLYGQGSGLLSPQQQERLQQLQQAAQSGQIDDNLRQELSNLQMQQDTRLRQNLANEFQQMQGQNQQSLTPAQQQRFQQLQQQQRSFIPGREGVPGRQGVQQLPGDGGYVPPGRREFPTTPMEIELHRGGAAGPGGAGATGGGAASGGAGAGAGGAAGAGGGATGGGAQGGAGAGASGGSGGASQ